MSVGVGMELVARKPVSEAEWGASPSNVCTEEYAENGAVLLKRPWASLVVLSVKSKFGQHLVQVIVYC